MTDEAPTAVEEQIAVLVREHFDWTGGIAPDADLRHDLDLDSLHLIELQVAVEDHFAVMFDPFDEQLADAFDTLRHLASYVACLLAKEA